MIICMRTTLMLDDQLLQNAKRRAADLRITVSEVVNQALRDALATKAPPARRIELPTYGASTDPSIALDTIANLRDDGER